MGQLIHELIFDAAARAPAAPALRHHGVNYSYAALARDVAQAGAALRALGSQRHDRVAVWLPSGIDAVVALFGAAAAGCALVPVDPECDGRRAALLLADAGPRVLVTTAARLAELGRARSRWPQLRLVVLCGEGSAATDGALLMGWQEFMALHAEPPPAATVETDLAALLYSGGAGRPTGIALSHRNLVAAADSAVRYLDIGARDRLLAALPLSLDQGLNQLTCAFAAGALVVLPEAPGADAIVRAVEREEITGLAGVPALWAELAGKDWGRATTLRYATSVGAPLARPLVDTLRRALPRTRIYLMYGFTEAFRSTCLAPEQIAWRPDSIGKPAPGAEVLVLRPDGRRCAPGEAGELVQRGPMVALGYWNDPKRTAARFRALPPRPGLSLPEMAVWSGDLVRADADGYLYVVRRADDSIRTGGIRVDPADVEQAVYDTGLVHEAAAVGVAHPVQGQVIAVLARARAGCRLDSAILFDACQARLPPYMLPTMVDVRRAPLPRAADGLIDRALLAGELAPLFAEATS
jgi:acyl-CoA ligase (AMP-forming) (exosortase A-associated)